MRVLNIIYCVSLSSRRNILSSLVAFSCLIICNFSISKYFYFYFSDESNRKILLNTILHDLKGLYFHCNIYLSKVTVCIFHFFDLYNIYFLILFLFIWAVYLSISHIRLADMLPVCICI